MQPGSPPTLFEWEVVTGAGGVTDDQERAFRHVQRELVDAPLGACGVVRRVGLAGLSGRVYADLGTVATARRDEATGAVVWGVNGWSSLNASGPDGSTGR